MLWNVLLMSVSSLASWYNAIHPNRQTRPDHKQDMAHIMGSHIPLKPSYLQLISSRFMSRLCWLCGRREFCVLCCSLSSAMGWGVVAGTTGCMMLTELIVLENWVLRIQWLEHHYSVTPQDLTMMSTSYILYCLFFLPLYSSHVSLILFSCLRQPLPLSISLWLFTLSSSPSHQITVRRQWKHVYDELGGNPSSTSAATCTRRHYER